MKLFSAQPQNLSPTKARNAALINQLATPGLGSLMAGRWVAGAGQLVLATAGCAFFFLWFIKVLSQYYGQIGGNVTAAPVAPVGWMGWLGLSFFVLSWIWSGVTSISILRSVTRSHGRSLENYAANLVKLDDAGIIASLTLLPGWERRDAMISREFVFKDFPEAMKFVNAVAAAAEEAWHHPDIDIRWNKVTLALTTHDAGGLTSKDFELARTLDKLSKRK